VLTALGGRIWLDRLMLFIGTSSGRLLKPGLRSSVNPTGSRTAVFFRGETSNYEPFVSVRASSITGGRDMFRVSVLIGAVLMAMPAFAQQSAYDQRSNGTYNQPYNRPIEVRHGNGGWGLLGLLGLAGLLGRRRSETVVRDEYLGTRRVA
jgi:MYXO-CTERM domain-containing protein